MDKQALYSLTPSYAWERPCCPTVLIRFLQLWCILSSFVSIKVQFTGEIRDETNYASKYTGRQCIKSKAPHLKIFRRIRRQYTNWTKASIWIFFRSERIIQQQGGLALVMSAEQMPPYCSITVTLINKLSPGKTSTRLPPASSLRGKNEWSWSSAN